MVWHIVHVILKPGVAKDAMDHLVWIAVAYLERCIHPFGNIVRRPFSIILQGEATPWNITNGCLVNGFVHVAVVLEW
jgi:hypothetical protein